VNRALLVWIASCAVSAGCAGVQLHEATPTLELREKPAHTCTRWRECFGQLWIGVAVPVR
jgi:O-acetyl-ADP-ribose deacetylase (regulator of RNase III)